MGGLKFLCSACKRVLIGTIVVDATDVHRVLELKMDTSHVPIIHFQGYSLLFVHMKYVCRNINSSVLKRRKSKQPKMLRY